MSESSFCSLFQLDDRAALAKKPRDRMNALLEAPDSQQAVQALSPIEFYDLYHGVGPGDAMALLEYAAPEQLQTCLDLDCWRGDEINDSALAPWIEQMLAVPNEKFADFWKHIDPEIMALYIHRNVRLYIQEDRNDEAEIPDDESPNLAQTPDFSYWVAYPEDPDKAELLKQLIDHIYAVFGVEKAWSMLEGMHWEMPTDLEENAYRFRTERIREYGYMPREEAASIFAAVNVQKEIDAIRKQTSAELYVQNYQAGEKIQMALAAADDSAAKDCYFSKILARISDRDFVKIQLLAAAQQIASYDGYQPHETDGFDDSMVLCIGYASIGLEYAAEHDDDAAERILRHTPLKRLVTLGFNVTLELRRKAKILISRGHLSIIEDQRLSLLTNDQRDCIEGLLLPRPRPLQSLLTPFISAHDIQSCAAVIADVAARELFFGEGLHKNRDEISLLAYSNDIVMGVENVNFDNVAITFLVRKAIQSPEPWNVLNLDEIPERSVCIDAVSYQNIRTLFRSSMPDSTTAALKRYAAQLQDYLQTQWPPQALRPDPALMQAMLIVDDE